MDYTFDELINRIKTLHAWALPKHIDPSPTPLYNLSLSEKLGCNGNGLGLAVKAMEHHMTDEGWQLMLALKSNEYQLAGHKCDIDSSNYSIILDRYLSLRKHPPGVVICQDKREWRNDNGRNDPKSYFTNLNILKDTTSTFKLTIVKDSQHEPNFHRTSADEIGCHAWIIYYHPKIVTFLASYLRPKHLVRTYHSIDSSKVPEYKTQEKRRDKALLSGAISRYYPLRQRISDTIRAARYNTKLKRVDHLQHPGYANTKCFTPDFLKTLSQYKVSICTSSMYGYALRKIMESIACGCTVITDLPSDEELPVIDSALVRIRPDITMIEFQGVVDKCIYSYNEDKAKFYSDRCKQYYNYQASGYRLVNDIEQLRLNYVQT